MFVGGHVAFGFTGSVVRCADMETQTNVPKVDKLKEALVRVKLLFGALPTPDYLDGFQKWLGDREREWQKTSLRVGLVGITSAGKSTFINALSGEDILPRGAQPTSGILVVCRRAEPRKLVVQFKNNSEDIFEGEDCNSIWVARYGDEKENPNNEQGVQELQLSLPNLMIPEKYDLIDSPGLDAFGLQGHEELTLRTLIPLVDVVLFLTTTKSTSDRENLRALGKICKEAKPALVIQTHKDAVEPRYMKGGQIVETEEQVLEKHYQRVKQLMQQTATLQEAPIIQVSSIQALNVRKKHPGVDPELLSEWEESGFARVTAVLAKLHKKLSQKIIERRLKLLLKEIQQLVERVKADYNYARGKQQEADVYRQNELDRLQRLEHSIPSEQTTDFPDSQQTQKSIEEIKNRFLQVIESGSESELEVLNVQVRDHIKTIESAFFARADAVDAQLKQIAEQLSLDLEAIKAEEQRHPSLPQLSRYEKMVKLEVIEQKGLVGHAKRIFGKFLKKEEWGYRQKEIVKTFIDRGTLKEDLLDYHSIYSVKLQSYLKRWGLNWLNSVASILAAISQRRDDLSRPPADASPEPYRALLTQIRELRDWLQAETSDSEQKRYTLSLAAINKVKQKTIGSMTVRTRSQLNLALPLLRAARTLKFTRKTHRFWYVMRQLASQAKPVTTVLVSTPFTQEIFDYFGIIGDLPGEEEKDFVSRPLVYTLDPEFALSYRGIPASANADSSEEMTVTGSEDSTSASIAPNGASETDQAGENTGAAEHGDDKMDVRGDDEQHWSMEIDAQEMFASQEDGVTNSPPSSTEAEDTSGEEPTAPADEEQHWSMEIEMPPPPVPSPPSPEQAPTNFPPATPQPEPGEKAVEECEITAKVMSDFAENSREQWFLQQNHVILFHDEILAMPGGPELFALALDKADVVFRVIDLHQIGHEKKRLERLPMREKIEQSQERLGYIGMGGHRLLKSGQIVDAYKSYRAMDSAPGFGLRPLLLGDGEDLLNSLLWLACGLGKQGLVADEIGAMEILNRTQENFVKGQEAFIRSFFGDVKEFKSEQDFLHRLESQDDQN